MSSMLLPIRPRSPQAEREVRRDSPLRRARTCYGHLAGVAGVQLMDALLKQGWLNVLPAEPDARRLHYTPTDDGTAALIAKGVAVPTVKSGKPVAFSCIDWTERRPHLAGPLGRAIVAALAASSSIEQSPGSRVVVITADLDSWLDT